MRHYLTLLVVSFTISVVSIAAHACRCLTFELSKFYQRSDAVFVFEASRDVIEENGVPYLSGRPLEVFKGSLSLDQDVLIDFSSGTSCEAPSGFNATLLVFAAVGEHGHLRAGKCSMWILEPANWELFEQPSTVMERLEDLRNMTHNKSLQRTPLRGAAELRR